jgi:ribosome-associated protein YbcJ (S4-like RNA binding protein)
MIELSKYINLAGDIIPSIFPRAYLFSSSDIDYSIPYTRRYFVKKINDNDVIEVEGDNFRNLPENIYKKSSINWQVSGIQRDVIKDGKVIQEGAYEYNRKQVKLAEKDMTGITLKISENYLNAFKD